MNTPKNFWLRGHRVLNECLTLLLRHRAMAKKSLVSVARQISMTANLKKKLPSYLSSRRNFSVESQKNEPEGYGSEGKPTDSGSYLPKIVVGTVAFGAAAMAAYQTGYFDKILVKDQHNAIESAKIGAVNKDSGDLVKSNEDSQVTRSLGEQIIRPNQESNISTFNEENSEKNIEDLSKSEQEILFQEKELSELTQEDVTTPIQEIELPESPQSSMKSDDESENSRAPLEESPNIKNPEENPNIENPEEKPSIQQHKEVEITPIHTQVNANPDHIEPPQNFTTEDMPEDASSKDMEHPISLLDAYYLRDDTLGTSATSSKEHQDSVGAFEDLDDSYISKDGKLVLDFLQAIHAAEKRQAELDARIFAEEKRKIKEKYEKELKDARAKELMYAEEVAILEKELNKERVKAVAALKSLQEKLEEKLKKELEQMEAVAELELDKVQELAKAELAAAIASEKASQIEKMVEANLHINALCMAFYARSEEARQSHSIHKLALGALALEDSLSKGLPIQKEIQALNTYLEGIDKDSLLDLVLSSLPEETQIYGTDTLLQLNRKFNALKGTLRHFSLIPPGGRGILAHSLAHVASWLKVKEADQSGDGIESVINRVESLLAKGKLSEAADTLEEGVKGSQAAEIVSDWVSRARNRAITEQALTLLQSYATSASLT